MSGNAGAAGGTWATRTRYLADLVGADAIVVSIAPDGSPTTYAAYNMGSPLSSAAAATLERAIATQTVVAADTETMLADDRVASSLCVAPLVWEGRAIGGLAGLRVGRTWDVAEQRALARSADLVALELAETHARVWWQRSAEAWQRRIALLERARVELAPFADGRTTLDAAAERVAALSGASGASVMLIDGENELVVRSAFGPHEHRARSARRRIGEGISGWVAKHAQPLVLRGRVDDARFTGVDPTIDESLVVPLRVGDRVLGVVATRATRVSDAGGAERLKDLGLVAGELALLIAHTEDAAARRDLTDQLESDRREAIAMYDLARLAGIGADPDGDLGGAVQLIAEAFDHEAVAIWTREPDSLGMTRRAAYGFGEVLPGDLHVDAHGVVARLLTEQRPHRFTSPLPSPLARFGLGSVILVPVIVSGESVGLLLLGRRSRPYADFDFSLAATMAEILSSLVRRELTAHAVELAEAERDAIVKRMQEEFADEMGRVIYVLDACQRLLGRDKDLPTDLARAARDARSALERVGIELGKTDVVPELSLPEPAPRLTVLDGGESRPLRAIAP